MKEAPSTTGCRSFFFGKSTIGRNDRWHQMMEKSRSGKVAMWEEYEPANTFHQANNEHYDFKLDLHLLNFKFCSNKAFPLALLLIKPITDLPVVCLKNYARGWYQEANKCANLHPTIFYRRTVELLNKYRQHIVLQSLKPQTPLLPFAPLSDAQENTPFWVFGEHKQWQVRWEPRGI